MEKERLSTGMTGGGIASLVKVSSSKAHIPAVYKVVD
jgi:hypothetical protein